MRRLAVLDAQHWYVRADGFAPVLADTAVTDSLAAARNLVLYATPGGNRVLDRIAEELPIQVTKDAVLLGGKRLAGPSLAARFAAPHPSERSRERLVEVVAGTDLAGLYLAAAANPCGSGSGYPDFVIFDAVVRVRGWAGIRAAGFWSPDGGFPEHESDAYIP
jgi:hypothetical protein